MNRTKSLSPSFFAGLALISLLPSPSALAFNNSGVMGGVVPFFQLVTGFSDDVWSVVSGSVPGALDKSGLVSRINASRGIMAASLTGTCASIPSSGTQSASDGGTLTFESPTHSAPPSFEKTGAYTKRITYTGTYTGRDSATYSITNSKEFYCDGSAASYDLTLIRNGSGTLLAHIESFYEKTSTETHFQAFVPSGTVGSSSIGFALKIVPADTKFELWASQANNNGTKWGGYRVAATTNYSTQKTSLYYTELTTSQECAPTSSADFTANAWAQSLSVVSAKAGNAVNSSVCSDGVTDFAFQGCMNDYDATASDVSSTTLCSGLDLSEAPKPGLDSTGDLTMAWVNGTLPSKLESP